MVKIKAIEKTKSGIEGFDELVDGGIPSGSAVLLTGPAGTGKTIFSLQYIYNGAKMFKERGIYITFEEKKKSLYQQAKLFGWDLDKLEKSNKIKIISIGTADIEKSLVREIIEVVKSFKAKRLVIDSITTLSYLFPLNSTNGSINDVATKRFLYDFISDFKEIEDLTALYISQSKEILADTTAEFICDGAISIDHESMGGDYSRTLLVKKMRKVKNDEDPRAVEISKDGIIVHEL